MNRRQNQCGAVFAFLNKTTCTRVEMNAKQVRQSFLPENSSDNPLKKSSLIWKTKRDRSNGRSEGMLLLKNQNTLCTIPQEGREIIKTTMTLTEVSRVYSIQSRSMKYKLWNRSKSKRLNCVSQAVMFLRFCQQAMERVEFIKVFWQSFSLRTRMRTYQ